MNIKQTNQTAALAREIVTIAFVRRTIHLVSRYLPDDDQIEPNTPSEPNRKSGSRKGTQNYVTHTVSSSPRSKSSPAAR